jgi:hypothetical protein
MLLTPLPIATFVRPRHELNALFPMLVTLSGIVMLPRPVQLSNALSPMLVTRLPIVTFLRPTHQKKASPPMLVTLSGIVMLVFCCVNN